MNFIPFTQEQLKMLNLQEGRTYKIEYLNKDYFNGETIVERGEGVVMMSGGQICFSVTDPYGMDKLVMQVRVLG